MMNSRLVPRNAHPRNRWNAFVWAAALLSVMACTGLLLPVMVSAQGIEIPIDADSIPPPPPLPATIIKSSAGTSSSGCSSLNLPVIVEPGDHFWPASVPDGAGGTIVAWQDTNNGATQNQWSSGPDVLAQHILACGSLDPAWPADGVRLSPDAGAQTFPVAAPDGAGGAYVAWENWSGSITSLGIFAQHVLSTGAVDPTWPTHGLPVSTGPGRRIDIKIAADGSGGAYVSWDDSRDGINNRHAFVHHLLPSGLDPAWAVNGVRACPNISTLQTFPEVCSDGAGGVLVVWDDGRNFATSGRDIYAQRMSSTGALLWDPNGVPVTTAPGHQVIYGDGLLSIDRAGLTQEQGSALVPDGAGGCFVTWTDQRNGGQDVYAQHLTSTGVVAPGWDANGVALCTDPTNQVFATILSDGTGGAFATWFDDRPGTFVQHVTASGVVDGPANGLSISAFGGFLPNMVSDGSHGAIVGWDDARNGDPDVFAQHLVTSGGFGVDPAWPVGGLPVSTAAGGQAPHGSAWLCRDGSGGAIFTWQDGRNGGDDLYSQRVLAAGTLPEFALTGHVTASCGAGLNGVAVDAYMVGSGDLVGTGVTNSNGAYSIPDLCWGSSYTVTVVTPLDFAATAQDVAANSCKNSVDFPLTCLPATPLSMGFWKHQVGVATGGNGQAQVDATTLCGYLDLVAEHFNNNLINQVIVYQPPPSGLCSDKLLEAKTLLNLQGSATMIAKARQQLLSLLLNVAANAINQTQVISADGATVSQAITYSDQLIDSPTGNYDTARSICDKINSGQRVPSGVIPLSTAQIAYRKGTEAISFRVMQASGGGAREYQFTTGARGPVNLRLYDVAGRIVAEIYGGTMDAGPHSVAWSGRTSSGTVTARGLYFARLTTPRESATIKVLQLTLGN